MEEPQEIRVTLYLSNADFRRYAELAVKAKKRPAQLPLFEPKPGNCKKAKAKTKGLTKLFRFAADAWAGAEIERVEKSLDLRRREREIEEEKKRLGLA